MRGAKFMNKYKINYIYDENNNINDILRKVLNRELKKYIAKMYKNKGTETSDLSLEENKNC